MALRDSPGDALVLSYALAGKESRALADLPEVYMLGVGGPEDESGIGQVDTFTWRYFVVGLASESPAVLGFTAMKHLMAFTRALNRDHPFTVPTEALLQRPSDLACPSGATLLLDPEPEAIRRLIDEQGSGLTT